MGPIEEILIFLMFRPEDIVYYFEWMRYAVERKGDSKIAIVVPHDDRLSVLQTENLVKEALGDEACHVDIVCIGFGAERDFRSTYWTPDLDHLNLDVTLLKGWIEEKIKSIRDSTPHLSDDDIREQFRVLCPSVSDPEEYMTACFVLYATQVIERAGYKPTYYVADPTLPPDASFVPLPADFRKKFELIAKLFPHIIDGAITSSRAPHCYSFMGCERFVSATVDAIVKYVSFYGGKTGIISEGTEQKKVTIEKADVHFSRYDDERKEAVAKTLFDIVCENYDMKMLKMIDVGCCDGWLERAIAEDGQLEYVLRMGVLAVDLSEDAIRYCNESVLPEIKDMTENIEFTFLEGNAFEILANGKFDIAVFSESMNYLYPAHHTAEGTTSFAAPNTLQLVQSCSPEWIIVSWYTEGAPHEFMKYLQTKYHLMQSKLITPKLITDKDMIPWIHGTTVVAAFRRIA